MFGSKSSDNTELLETRAPLCQKFPEPLPASLFPMNLYMHVLDLSKPLGLEMFGEPAQSLKSFEVEGLRAVEQGDCLLVDLLACPMDHQIERLARSELDGDP